MSAGHPWEVLVLVIIIPGLAGFGAISMTWQAYKGGGTYLAGALHGTFWSHCPFHLSFVIQDVNRHGVPVFVVIIT